MIFKDIELEFDIFDADTAEAYEEAVSAARDAALKQEGENLGGAIRRQCRAVFHFFDTLFGAGTHKEIFGERTNLMECIVAFRDFIKLVEEQKGALDALMAEAELDTAPSAPNRAARRAASKRTLL